MNAKSRRKIEMAMRVLEWSKAHQDTSPGYAAAVSRLESLVARADQLATQQRDGLSDVRRATGRKVELRRTMKMAHLAHLANVAELASAEEPELAEKFVLPRLNNSHLAFRTAARAIAAEAESRKELLVKHGLSETVLQALTQSLDEFDGLLEEGARARAAHVGASTELDTVAGEGVQVVNVMTGINRTRYGRNGELLAAWETVSKVLATPHSAKSDSDGESSASGEVRPAA